MSYEYKYARFRSTGESYFDGDGYDTGAEYSLSDGIDLKGNFTVPSSSVVYNKKFLTIDSDFDTGVPFNTIRGGANWTIALGFKKDSIPSSRIYFFRSNAGNPDESSLYWDTDGDFYWRDRFGGVVTKFETWDIIGGSDTKTTSELLNFTGFNKIIITQTSAGNYKWYFNGYQLNPAPTGNPLTPSVGNWSILTSETIDLFNLIYDSSGYSDSSATSYFEAEAEEIKPINFPDGTTTQEFIISEQPKELGYGEADRKILSRGVKFGNVNYQVSKTGLQQIQNTTLSFANEDQFYHQMRELNGNDFWIGLQVDFFWHYGRVPTLVFDGVDWKEDGETTVSFTPSNPYPLIDSIKKEFSGYVERASIDKMSLSLSFVSQEKQDSYLIGNIESENGADASRSLINPILVGDMTDDDAYVPVILNNSIYRTPSAICSDVDLSVAPTLYVYDDESELFHEVQNKQVATDSNKKIVFYDDTVSKNVTTDGEFVSFDLDDIQQAEVLRTDDGEIVSKFSNAEEYFSLSKKGGGYTDSSAYLVSDAEPFLNEEGSRNFDDLTDFSDDDTKPSNPLDSDLITAKANVSVELKPISLKLNTTLQEDYDFISSSGTYNNFTKPTGTPEITFRGSNASRNSNSSADMEIVGQYKGVLNYENWDSTNYPHEETSDDNYNYLMLAPFLGQTIVEPSLRIYGDFNYYAYENFGFCRMEWELNPFKFEGDVRGSSFSYRGGIYQDINKNANEPNNVIITNINSQPAIKLDYTNSTGGSSLRTVDFTIVEVGDTANPPVSRAINEDLDLGDLDTVEDFNNANFGLLFYGYSFYNPCVASDPFSKLDSTNFITPSYYGRNRFALDGFKFNLNVSAIVESKYWCCKAKTGTSVSLLDGLNELSEKYTGTTITKNDSLRDDYQIAGVHTGEPIYYRDLLSKICSEFRIFLSDENGTQSITSMGGVSPVFTIDSSNTFSPWFDFVKMGETSSSEIYNEIVLRYSKNDMTGKYGKTIKIGPDTISYPNDLDELLDRVDIGAILIAKEKLTEANSTLSKMGISKKTKTIELDWVRDNTTAIKILNVWARNVVRQKATAKATVSKRAFLNAKIGDGVSIDFPKLPKFYKDATFQINKIINKSDNVYEIELEEYL